MTALKIDPLRERLAGPELQAARATLERGGISALVSEARTELARHEDARARFEILTRDFERHPSEREALIEAWLRETVTDKRALRADLRARKEGKLDLDALGERVLRLCAGAERAAEAQLAIARVALQEGYAPPTELSELFELARSTGQWSRRTEALGLVADLAKHGIGAELHESIAVMARALTTRTEHRWVQAAAIATLAAVDVEGATAIARERLANPGTGDDFLVRERIVELAARGALGEVGWSGVVNLALGDASEHVRITVARAERDTQRLRHLAASDASPKVRAAAAIGLSQHDAFAAESVLTCSLRNDRHELVVRIAAEELVSLARRDGLRNLDEAFAAFTAAEARTELSAKVRAKIADCLAEVAVFSDPISSATYDILAPIVAETPVGTHAIIHDQLLRTVDDGRLGQVLAVLAQNDFAIGVDRRPSDGAIVLHRGETRSAALWRVLHEMKNPGPSKRQAFDHTLGRKPKGQLRAPPGGLAELTATRVPGERVLVERAGGWGRHLPMVDDLIAAGTRGEPVSIVASGGTTTLHPPKGLLARVRGYLTLTLRYAELAELRRRALDSDETATQAAFVNEVANRTGIAIRYQPHDFALTERPLAPSRRVSPRGLRLPAPTVARASQASPERALLGLLPVAGAIDWTPFKELGHDLVQYASSPQGNRLPHLAAYVTVMLGAFLVRSVAIKKSIEHDREAIPLVIGGWGTRGKSGTERLKAALFQGLGHEVLVKTTGCEAMFIHGIPGQVAREVFIYRPYDKATVWEQRDQLALARAFGVRVFLWECMALQPDLVNMLQSQWMRDDYSTITNAYPDHEDVQGPSGWDVANVISEFVPSNGNLLTAEDQMLPILRERAKERGTQLRVVSSRDADLIADDVLARFPYAEHPRNIALVTQLARALGIPSAVALAEMADHVVPDLGVLKEYPEVPHRGRTLSFVNGMSANERTAALGNYVRTGFADHDPDVEPKTWNITVVNNRGDRIARSEVFARFLVEDVSAHRHVLIGTNVAGLRGFIREALDRHLVAISPTNELSGDGTERLKLARARLERAFARLKIGRTDAESVLLEMSALSLPNVDARLVERLLEPAEPGERYEASLTAVDHEIPAMDEESRPFVVRAIARRRAVRGIHALLGRDLGVDPLSIDRAFARVYRAIFEESIISVDDPQTTGDQILDIVARSVPKGVHARILGCQNIKGTGLDFVYRWVSIDTVMRHLANLHSAVRETRDEALRALTLHGDYGLLDAKVALAEVEAAQKTDPHATVLPYDVALARLREVVSRREKKLVRRSSRTFGESVRAAIGKTFDYLDAPRRRKMAHTLLEDLVRMRVSHASAAKRMRDIVARAKGGWMLART